MTHGTWRLLVDTTSVENIIGTAYDDHIYGDGNNNTYTYTGGMDKFDGGAGSDTLDLSRMTSAIWFGNDQAWTLGTADTLHGTWRPLVDTTAVENVIGTAYDDRIYGDGGSNTYAYTGGMDQFDGGAGSDTLDLSRMTSAVWFGNEASGIEAWTRDTADTFHGSWRPLVDTTSVENVIGTAYDDRIYGDGNDNTYTYTGGMDTFDGGAGSDTLDLSRMTSAIWFGNDPSGFEAWTTGTADTFHGIWRPLVDTTSVENIIGTAYDDRIRGDAGANQITGGDGKDLLNGMGGGDTFIYRAASESSGTKYDVITGFNAATDKFDFPFAVTGVDATVSSGSLSTISFDSDLAAAVGAGQLAGHDAVLFNVSAGSLVGDTFLIVDANGIPGYQAGQDFVFQLDTPSNLPSLGISDF